MLAGLTKYSCHYKNTEFQNKCWSTHQQKIHLIIGNNTAIQIEAGLTTHPPEEQQSREDSSSTSGTPGCTHHTGLFYLGPSCLHKPHSHSACTSSQGCHYICHTQAYSDLHEQFKCNGLSSLYGQSQFIIVFYLANNHNEEMSNWHNNSKQIEFNKFLKTFIFPLATRGCES